MTLIADRFIPWITVQLYAGRFLPWRRSRCGPLPGRGARIFGRRSNCLPKGGICSPRGLTQGLVPSPLGTLLDFRNRTHFLGRGSFEERREIRSSTGDMGST
jgi:hypothetical protein